MGPDTGRKDPYRALLTIRMALPSANLDSLSDEIGGRVNHVSCAAATTPAGVGADDRSRDGNEHICRHSREQVEVSKLYCHRYMFAWQIQPASSMLCLYLYTHVGW